MSKQDSYRTPVQHFTLDRRAILMGAPTLAAASALGAGVPLQVAQAQQPAAPPIAPSPSWMRALPTT
jgi:hypothetical protein